VRNLFPRILVGVGGLACVASGVWAQQPGANPVTSAVKQMIELRQKNIVAAADAMPEAKYGFKPTPEQGTFGHLIEHSAGANYMFCSKLAGESGPKPEATEKDGKAKLVGDLKKSFEYCSTALNKLDDAHLSDPVELFGGTKATKGAAVLYLSASWGDHYSTEAMYLRLNGLLPPTAKKE
jgi:hypothetical protein